MSDLPMIATVADVAKWLGWTESKLRARLHTGRGHPPYTRPAGSIEFRRDDVLAWYAALPTTQPANDPKPSKRRQSAPRKKPWPDQALRAVEQELEQDHRPASAIQPLRSRTAQYISRATTG